MMKKLKALFANTAFNIMLIFVLTGFVFWLTIRGQSDQIFTMLRTADVKWILIIIFLIILERIMLGFKLMTECRQSYPKYTLSQGVINAYVAGLFNNITPSASGGQFMQVLTFRRQGIPVTSSIGVLWLDFIVYQTTMILFVLVLILLKFNYFYTNYSQFFLIVIFGFIVSSAVIVFLWAVVKSPKLYTWITTKGIDIGCRLHLIKDKQKTLDNVNQQLERFSKEVVVLRTHKKMVLICAVEDLLRLLLYYSIPFFCAKALHVKVGMDLFLDIVALSSFVTMVNAFMPMPGSSGGTEATFVLMFSTIFSRIDASSIMILWRVMTFYLTLLFGSIVYAYSKMQKAVVFDDEVLARTYSDKALQEYEQEFEKEMQ